MRCMRPQLGARVKRRDSEKTLAMNKKVAAKQAATFYINIFNDTFYL